MPEPPPTSALSHYLFENPWPAAAAILLIGLVVLWRALREGRRTPAIVGALACLLAVAIALAGMLVTTSGERAEAVVGELVRAAEAGDVGAASALFSGGASINFDDPANPSLSRATIDRGLATLADRNRIESNSVTRLRGYSVDSETGVVHLACRTRTASSLGTLPSEWVLRVKREPDGTWRILRLTCVSIAGRSVSGPAW